MTTIQRAGTALVTGAARRIGLCIATRLAEAGYAVALHTRASSRDVLMGEVERLAARGLEVQAVIGDLTDPQQCRAIVAEAAARCGPLDLLVNNAALFEADSAMQVEPDVWDGHFAVNLRAPVLLTQAFVTQAKAGRDAAVINIIDQRVLRPTPQYFSYTLSKAALWMATQTMAQALAESGIRVNAIGPGPVYPNHKDGEAGFSREIEGVPLHRAVAPDEIAATVLYLAKAKGVTGQIIAVDAGQHIGWRTPDIVD